jgi:microcystin-dependent protein
MALQSQTYANTGDGYYIRGAEPIVPGDQAIIGPVEILPADISTQPTYYNRFIQTNATGLAIAEYRTAGNELLSDVILNTQNSILLTSRRTGEEAVLEVGVNQAGDAGRVTINANDGLVVKNLAGAGKGLQIYHDGPTNQNRLEVADISPAGARMNFNVNTSDITFTNDVTADFMKISPQTNTFQVETPGAGLTAMTPGGVGFIGVGTNGRVGPFGGSSVTLDSSQGVTIRTSSGVAPLPNYNTITANANGTVVFLSTVTAPTVNAITGNISTINSDSINNSASARIASVNVTNNNQGTSVPYITYYGNYQGNLRYNTIRDTAGAPATAIESLEIINVSGGAQTGGIQFYTANNGTPANVKWMGGFQENNVGGGQSQFVLPSTVQGSIPQLVNVSTINNISILDLGNPVGTIISFAAWNPPAGYLRCDGASYATATYPRLYAVIGNIYGGSAPNFNVPDCLGKTTMGALATYSLGGTALLSTYQANAVFQGLVTGITGDPLGVTTGLWFSSSDRPVTPGMLSQGQTGFNSTSYVVLHVVGGNGMRSGINDGFLVMFTGNIIALTGLTPGQIIPFNPNPTTAQGQQYPMLGNQDATSVGIGNMNLFQLPSEVGAHVHSGTPDTAIAAVAGGGGPLGNRGGNSATNSGAFNFTRPAYTIGSITYPAIGVAAPKTMNHLPYNLGVTMCIKT